MPSNRQLFTKVICLACAVYSASSAIAANLDAALPVDRLNLAPHAAVSMIVVTPARSGPASEWLEVNGVLVPDARSIHDVNAYVTGEVSQVFVRVGDHVKPGSPLASVYSPDFIAAQKTYLALTSNEEQKAILKEEGRLSDYMKAARDNLKWWGLTPLQLATLERLSLVTEQIVLAAEIEGVVTQVLVEPGALINAGDKTMKAFIVTGKAIARMVSTSDPFRVDAFVFPSQLPLLRIGARVKLTGPGEKTLDRKLSEILPEIDTATQRARFSVDLVAASPWPPGTALRVAVELTKAQGTWVPRDAVLSQHLDPIVYVRIAPLQFERKHVSVLAETQSEFQVSGILPYEEVVTSGKTLLEGALRMQRAPTRANDRNHNH
jgi:membrane fusion protein, copper/silver efflux system